MDGERSCKESRLQPFVVSLNSSNMSLVVSVLLVEKEQVSLRTLCPDWREVSVPWMKLPCWMS